MVRVQRGNVVLKVKEFEVQRYLSLGYDLTDDSGNIVKEAVPHDSVTLQKAYLEHTAKIAELEDTIAKLTAELNEAKKATKSADKNVETSTPKPTSKSRQTKTTSK